MKGPLETPSGGGYRSSNVRLREEFKLFANLRPSRTIVPGGRYDLDAPVGTSLAEALRERAFGEHRARRIAAAQNVGADVLDTVCDRMHNDVETERKVIRNELAKINRTRLERMLGPEGGYQNW